MTGAKFDIEKFDGTDDFGLWRIKMRALLIQHGCEAALQVLPADMEAQAKAELNKKAHSVLILYLGNKVLREVTEEMTAAGVWTKLETLYMTKSLANKLYLKKKLYTFYMWGRTDRRDSRQSKGKSRSKSQGGRLKCYICQSDDHLKRNCPKNDRKKSTGYVRKDDQPSSSVLTYDDSEVMMGMNAEALLDWIMDSRGTVRSESGEVKVINGSRVVLSGIRRDNCIYSLDVHAVASEDGLQVLEKQDLFGKNSLGKLDFYENCVLGKSHRVSFSVGRHTTQGVIDYVHSDLWGPSQVESLGGKRSPSTAIEKKKPMEMWSGHPSDYGMLIIFGCVAYSHVKQGKLEPRAVKYVLLRYREGVKGYRLYRLDGESPKIVTSRNVVFNESVMYKDTLKDSGAGIDKSVEELQVEVEL
ncbi:zinc finger, CCHC-type containing protein [Tanacetum coccineum]